MTPKLGNSRRAISPVPFRKVAYGNIAEPLISVIVSSKRKIFHQLQLLRNFHEEFYIVDRHFVELHVTACFNKDRYRQSIYS